MREFFTYGSVRGAARKGRSLPRLRSTMAEPDKRPVTLGPAPSMFHLTKLPG